MSFLMQVYANLDDPAMANYHRMIYVFVCVSEHCIGTQRAVQCLRGIINTDNEKMKFASDEEYRQIQLESDDTLIIKGLLKDNQDAFAREEPYEEVAHDEEEIE
jgi:hypothetical protein